MNKNKSRLSDPKGKRTEFVDQLDRLWDIGAEDAVEVIQQNKLLTPEKKEEDISFYRDQQNQRLGRMSGMDKIYAARMYVCMCFYGAYNDSGLVRQVSGFSNVSVSA